MPDEDDCPRDASGAADRPAGADADATWSDIVVPDDISALSRDIAAYRREVRHAARARRVRRLLARRGTIPALVLSGATLLAGIVAVLLSVMAPRTVGHPPAATTLAAPTNAPGTLHGHCRLTLKGDRGRSGVHIDPAFYSGILYLTPPEHCRGGTDFFRHRPTGLERVPATDEGVRAAGFADHNALIEQVVNKDTLSPGRWEKVFTAPMRFNRLVLFSPWLFHNAASGFGDGSGNGRLVYLMFFARRPA